MITICNDIPYVLGTVRRIINNCDDNSRIHIFSNYYIIQKIHSYLSELRIPHSIFANDKKPFLYRFYDIGTNKIFNLFFHYNDHQIPIQEIKNNEPILIVNHYQYLTEYVIRNKFIKDNKNIFLLPIITETAPDIYYLILLLCISYEKYGDYRYSHMINDVNSFIHWNNIYINNKDDNGNNLSSNDKSKILKLIMCFFKKYNITSYEQMETIINTVRLFIIIK